MSESIPAHALNVSSWLLVVLSATVISAFTSSNVLWLAHVRVKVVEVAQLLCPETRVRVSGIVPLVMLNVDEDIVFLCCGQKLLVML
ncbi:D-galacturonic acid reductase [Alternaria alternata]|nr:D-galacturonic acid reductase [Alternaria alternata]